MHAQKFSNCERLFWIVGIFPAGTTDTIAASYVNYESKLLTSMTFCESVGRIGASMRRSRICSWSNSANQGCASTSWRPPCVPRRFYGVFSSSFVMKSLQLSDI